MTKPVDYACRHILGFSPEGALQRIHDAIIVPLLGQSGAAESFYVSWRPDETLSWFGPFGFLLIIPAVAYALVRGHRRIKAIAIAITGYLYIMAFAVAWTPANGRFFTVFYACGVVCAASFLPPWRLTGTGKRAIRAACAILLVYACICNTGKPAIGIQPALSGVKALISGNSDEAGKLFQTSLNQSIWIKVFHERNRQYLEPDE